MISVVQERAIMQKKTRNIYNTRKNKEYSY